jgi:hypothetical protein
MLDPIVNEVRQYRDEHARKFNYDINAICNDYKLKHNEYLNLLNEKKRTSANKKNAAYG